MLYQRENVLKLRPNGNNIYRHLTLTNQRSVHTLYFRVLSRFQNKEKLFPYRTLNDCFYNRDLTLGSSVVTIYTTGLTLHIYTFSPLFIYVLYLSQNKQRLVPLTA